MAAKEKPEPSQIRNRLKGSGSKGKPSKTVVTGMYNELRAHILILLNERTASRPEICRELGADWERVRHELNVLKNTEPPLIELICKRKVRGAIEKFYKATAQAYIDPSEWPGVPDAIKGQMRGSLLNLLVDDAVAAIDKGTFDALPGAHMSWSPMILDDQGWADATAILFRAMNEVLKVKGQSAKRLLAKDAKGTSCTVSMLGYPSANADRKVGPPCEEAAREARSRKGGKKGSAGRGGDGRGNRKPTKGT